MVRRALNSVVTFEGGQGEFYRQPKKGASPGSAARAKTTARCSIRNSPNCDALRDKFITMQGEIIDQIKMLEGALAKSEAFCTKTEEDLMAQISDAETKLNDAQTV